MISSFADLSLTLPAEYRKSGETFAAALAAAKVSPSDICSDTGLPPCIDDVEPCRFPFSGRQLLPL
jgi:hypothetical protein